MPLNIKLRVMALAVLLLTADSALANSDQRAQTWAATFINRELNSSWNFFQEIQWRYAHEGSHLTQTVIRPALIYKFSEKDQFTFGAGTVISRATQKGATSQLHMLWQQYLRTNLTRYWTQARFRLEERWREEGGGSGQRFRFLWRLDFPLHERGGLVASSETFLNLNRRTWNGNRTFDQHRLLFGYQSRGEGVNWATNYIWQYIPRTTVDTSVHVLQLMLLL